MRKIPLAKSRLHTGDHVLVISGKDRGKTGVIEKVYPVRRKVVVTGLNIMKKSTKPTRRNPRGGFLEVPNPLHLSKILLVCPNCGKPTRVGLLRRQQERIRVCQRCKKPIVTEKRNEG